MRKYVLAAMVLLLVTCKACMAEAELFYPTETIQSITDGLSVVSFRGDDGFSGFLAQGGASSDKDVVKYVLQWTGEKNPLLQFVSNMFGCSTLSAANSNGDRLFGRNFDWYHCNALIVESIPEEGYASISTVNTDFITAGTGLSSQMIPENLLTLAALYAPLDGMNEKGFAVSVNMIQDRATIRQETDKPDLTTTTAVRLLLNQAASVEEAIALLSQYDLHASMGWMVHFAMADATGRSVVVEYIDQQMVVTETPVVTNFYLTPGDKYGVGTAQSMTRYETLMDTLENTQTLEVESMQDALESVSKHHFSDGETTEWSIVFNLTTGEVWYAHREDFTQWYGLQWSGQKRGELYE